MFGEIILVWGGTEKEEPTWLLSSRRWPSARRVISAPSGTQDPLRSWTETVFQCPHAPEARANTQQWPLGSGALQLKQTMRFLIGAGIHNGIERKEPSGSMSDTETRERRGLR